MDPASARRHQAPVGSSIRVAEHRMLAAGQHRSHPSAFARKRAMPHQIHLRQVRYEPADAQAIRDLLVCQP
jgi:hypothetical protein